MKRLSTKLISCSKITTSSTSISGNFTTQCTTSSSSSISKSPIQKPCINHNLKPCSNSEGLFYKPYKTQQFHKNPSQNYSSNVGVTPYFPSNQRKTKKKSKIEEVFEATKSAEEMLEAFQKMGAKFDEGGLSLACMKIAFNLYHEGEDPEKVVSFANRALAVFDLEGENKCSRSSLYVAMTLQLLGSICYNLKRFNDALGCFNRANKILVKLEDDGKFSAKAIKPILLAVQNDLADVHAAMVRIEDVVDNLRKSLEIKEFLMGKDSREFGNANRVFAEECVKIKYFKVGLPYCLKALEIHLGLLGEYSVEVALDRRVLGVIYAGMEEHEKAFEENRLAQKVLKNWGCTSDWLRAVIDAANMHIALGKSEVAINTLKEHEKALEENSDILITMGVALIQQRKFADAKGCLEIACSVLGRKEKSKPLEIAVTYTKISTHYETMLEFEAAISLLKRALALLDKSPQQHLHLQGSVSCRIGGLLWLTGKVTEAIPYLESAVETTKESFGSKHFALGYAYNNLGAAYLELERTQSAAQMFAAAKDIIDASLGPHHNDSIHACQNLSKAYAAMESYPLAIEFQQKAVDAWKGHGSSGEDRLREASQLLEQLKAVARGASSKYYPTKARLLP